MNAVDTEPRNLNLTLKVTDSERKAFKAFAAINGKDMSDIMRAALAKYLREDMDSPEIAAMFEASV